MTTSENHNKRAIVITGPVGAGKTTTAMALAEMLEHDDISCAMVDMDQLRWFHPTPEGDPFGETVGRKHLRYMAQTWRELGIPTVILADVIENADGKQALADALPGYDLSVVRLNVEMDRLHARLHNRETERQIAWHLNRAQELQEIMIRNGVGDIIIDVGDENPEQISTEIARRFGLL